jgi:hypothetical protein
MYKNNMSDINTANQDNVTKKTQQLCKQLKKIIDEIEHTVSPSSLPNQQNNTRVAGVTGSVIDNSYHYWTSSLRT